MSQNTSGAEDLPGADDAVVNRAAQRALARRQAVYTDEVRRLLDAGMEVMRQAGTSRSPRVADIIEAAGLSRDAFYRHFASKEDLVAAIVEAGRLRLVGYLRHQMGKERDPEGRLRRWIEGVMSQAADPGVAHATRAVLWNGSQVTGGVRPEGAATYGDLADLLIEPLTALGSGDPARDAAVISQAVMGRMQEFLWQGTTPARADLAHLIRFCTAAISGDRPGGGRDARTG